MKATRFHVGGGAFFVREGGDHAGVADDSLAGDALPGASQIKRTLNIGFFAFVRHFTSLSADFLPHSSKNYRKLL